MAGRQRLGAELARSGEQFAELDRHVAVDAGHRRLARHIALGEAVDHRLLETALIVEDIVRDADRRRDRAGVVDVLPGAAGALAVSCRAVVVELQGNADDVIALGLEQRGRHRGIDAAGHGDHDDARVLRRPLQIEAVQFPADHGAVARAPSGAAELVNKCRKRPATTIGGDSRGAMRGGPLRQDASIACKFSQTGSASAGNGLFTPAGLRRLAKF